MLGLQNLFSNPEVLILPLLLQNKTTIAEDLMRSQPEIQCAVVTYLDNLLSPDIDLLKFLNKYTEYVELDFLKNISKLSRHKVPIIKLFFITGITKYQMSKCLHSQTSQWLN